MGRLIFPNIREPMLGSDHAVHGSALKRVKMNALLQEYLPLVIFIGVSLAIGLVLLIAPFIVAYRQPDPEKLSAYECGFNAFDDARMKFDVRFYLCLLYASPSPRDRTRSRMPSSA